jgi:energy-coupling factor transport system ATP-binding protein
LISVRDFTYTYPAAPEPAVCDINLEVEPGRFLGIVGANLSGKSTLCYALSGFIPDFYNGTATGQVRVAGRDLLNTPLAELAGEVGLVFANPFNQITGARFTVREELAFGLENLGCPRDEMLPRIEESLRLTGLSDLADRSPYALSGGQQQRLAIASVMVMRPKVLVLDEPTSQLDPLGTREVFQTLDSLTRTGMTVVLAEHKLEWIAVYADRVILLRDGRIARDGLPREVLVDPALEEYGLSLTRYTRAARLALERGLVPAGRTLPVTLDQAREFFADADPTGFRNPSGPGSQRS